MLVEVSLFSPRVIGYQERSETELEEERASPRNGCSDRDFGSPLFESW